MWFLRLFGYDNIIAVFVITTSGVGDSIYGGYQSLLLNIYHKYIKMHSVMEL
jgi:hypothetical protein